MEKDKQPEWFSVERLDLRRQLHEAVKRGDEAEIQRLQAKLNGFAREEFPDNG